MTATIGFFLVHILAFILLTAIACATGSLFTRKLACRGTAEELVVASSVGLGLLGSLLGLLGVLGLLRTAVVGTLLGLILALGIVRRRDAWPAMRQAWAQHRKRNTIVVSVIALLLAPAFLLALYPPTAFDATMYHLPYAKTFATEGRLTFIPSLRFPVFPQLFEMLYTATLLLYDDIGAQLVHLLAAILTGALLVSWGSRLGSTRAGLWAAAAWSSSPLVILVSTIAYVDLGLALFATLALYSWWVWREENAEAWLVLSGLCAGFAAGTKYLGLFFVVTLGFATAIAARPKRLRPTAVFMLAAIAALGLWYGRLVYETGNPVFPFFSNVFGENAYGGRFNETIANPEGDPVGGYFGARLAELLSEPEIVLLAPWRLVSKKDAYRAAGHDGMLAPVYLLLIPIFLVVVLFNPRLRLPLSIVVLYMGAWFFQLQDPRYLLPILPAVSFASMAGLHSLFQRTPLLRNALESNRILPAAVIALLLSVPGLVYSIETLRTKGAIPTTAGDRDEYLTRAIPVHRVIRHLDRIRTDRDPLYCLFCENAVYLSDRKIIGDHIGPFNFSIVTAALGDGATLYDTLARMGIRYLLINHELRRVELPWDAIFRQRFTLLYAHERFSLFAIASESIGTRAGPNLLVNPGFEELSQGHPVRWVSAGQCRADASGSESHSGQVAIECQTQANVLFQVARVEPDRMYLLRYKARADQPGQMTRTQVNWLRSDGTFVSTDINIVPVETSWSDFQTLVTAPANVTTASIYVSPHDNSIVWFDEFELTSIETATERALRASPNPILECDGSGLGTTTLHWSVPGADFVEVHVDAPDGELFSSTHGEGSATTGKWVTDGMTFYLQDVSNGRPLTAANTIDQVAVRLSSDGCE